jgi:hypothetical protein
VFELVGKITSSSAMTEACDIESSARARHLQSNWSEELSDEYVCKETERPKKRDGEWWRQQMFKTNGWMNGLKLSVIRARPF